MISLVNISATGAMIETATLLRKGVRLTISCGTVNVLADVIWRGPNREYGVRFERPLKEREVAEQVARSHAVMARRHQARARRANVVASGEQG